MKEKHYFEDQEPFSFLFLDHVPKKPKYKEEKEKNDFVQPRSTAQYGD
jgi:hypothetical protein